MQIVRITDRYEGSSYYTVATADPSEVGRLKQLGEQKGFLVGVSKADTFEQAMSFLRGV